MIEQLYYGDVPVPWTLSWSGEEQLYIGKCSITGKPAVMQESNRGEGKPLFGSPHMGRQRQCIVECRCDLCGKRLNKSTKVSLSHAAVRSHSYNGNDVLQVEPLLHKACAKRCLTLCPSLKRDIKNGTLNIYHVTKHDVQFAWLKPEAVREVQKIMCSEPVIGHAKVWIQKATRKTERWLA